MRFTKLGLQSKSMALMGAVMVITTAITVSVFSRRAHDLIASHSQERLETIQKSFTFNAEYGLIVKDDATLNKLAHSVEEQKDIEGALVLDREGRVASGPSLRFSPERTSQIRSSVMGRLSRASGSPHVSYTITSGPEILNVLVDGVFTEQKQSAEELGLFESDGNAPKELIGYGVVVSSPKRIHAEIKEVRNAILLTNATLTAIVLAFLFVITKLLVSALDRLNAAMKRVGQGEISVRVSIRSNDEVEELSDGFNSMAEALQKTTVSRDSLVKEIEERKRLEKMVLQSEKMAAVGQLAGGVAHEINNPLGVILGFSQSLVKRLRPDDPLEMPLKSIEREAVRCKHLVQDLLTFSRTSNTDREDIDLNEAVDSALPLILAQAKVKNITLVKELDPGLPKAHANKHQIQQVLLNLCNNAMDAIGEDGMITLRTKTLSQDGEVYAQIQVQDTGPGVPKRIQAKIFEPFFTTKEVGKGTGLGLSLVYEIVQKHGGQILLESEPGKGAMFTVMLPIRAAGTGAG